MLDNSNEPEYSNCGYDRSLTQWSHPLSIASFTMSNTFKLQHFLQPNYFTFTGGHMSFTEIRFPENISYGSAGGPEFSTDVVTTHNGCEQRNITY